MQQYAEPVTDLKGNVVPGALVTILNLDNTLATLFDTDGVSSLANPVTADAQGVYTFQAANGNYRRTVSIGGNFYSFPGQVTLFDAANVPKIVDARNYPNIVAAAIAAIGGSCLVEGVFNVTQNQILELSAVHDVLFFGSGRLRGPAVAPKSQPTAYLRFWGSLGPSMPYGAAIAEGVTDFAVANSLAVDDLILLSNFPTHSTDAYTEGGPNIFGERARNYADFSPANFRQTRRKEILTVRSSTGSSFKTYTGALHAYTNTQGLQVRKINAVRNVRFIGITFENLHVDTRYTRDLVFQDCPFLSSNLIGQTNYNSTLNIPLFDARGTDCRLDFYEKCRTINFSGLFCNIDSQSDNAILKFLGCDDVRGSATVEGCKNSNGFMGDTAFTENPSGYSDLPSENGIVTINARACEGQGAALTCDPYAAELKNWTVHYSGKDTGIVLKGTRNIDLYANIGWQDLSGNSMFFLGATDTKLNGTQKGGVYSANISDPRNPSVNTRATTGTLKIGEVLPVAGFLSYLSATTAAVTGDGTEVQLVFDSELFDRTGSQSAGMFTAPKTGIYPFSVTLKITGVTAANTDGWIRIDISGTSYYAQPSPSGTASSAGNCAMAFNQPLPMQAGQVARAYLLVAGGSSKTVSIRGGSTIESSWSAYQA